MEEHFKLLQCKFKKRYFEGQENKRVQNLNSQIPQQSVYNVDGCLDQMLHMGHI